MRGHSAAVMLRRAATAITVAMLAMASSCAGLTGGVSERQVGDRGALPRNDTEAGTETNTGSDNDEAAPNSESGDRGSRTASLLPPAVSAVWEVGETGLYVTADDGATEVVAFDLSTGLELYRVDTHPAGSLRGLPPSVHIDEREQLFLAPVVTEQFGELFAVLGAYDLDTGEQVWEADFPIGGTPMFECAGEQVCARGDYDQVTYAIDSGRIVFNDEVNATTVIAADGWNLIAIMRGNDNPDEFLGLMGLSDYGRQEDWRLTTSELAELLGMALDPGWGWNSDVDSGAGIAALTLAHADAELVGGTVGVDISTGRTVWSRAGIGDCVYNYPEARPMLKCVASDDDPGLVDQIVRMDPATGDELWTIDIADPFAPYDVEIVHGTEYLYVWIGEQVLVYDLDDGRPVLSDGPFLCANSVWSYDVDYYADEEPWEYFANTMVVLCDADGFLLNPVDVADTIGETDIAASRRVSFDWELRPFVLDAIPQAMIDDSSGEA